MAVFRKLKDQLNTANSDSNWSISVNAVTKREQFWAVADANRGHIQAIELSFVTPNIWGGTSETENALKALGKENNAPEVEVTLKNKDGQLNPDSDGVRKSVEYISEGGGSAKIKNENGALIYSSEHEESVVTASPSPDFAVQESDTGMLRSLIERIFRR